MVSLFLQVFDTSKIPDIYDNALYDMVHNEHLGLPTLAEIFETSRTLARYATYRRMCTYVYI